VVSLVKTTTVIGEVPVRNRIEGSTTEGQIIGKAKLEQSPSGHVIAVVELPADVLKKGFSLGSLSVSKET
jgi:cytoskeletal protein CcmA (bactofilin family)